jgi:GTP-binding protein EngB required for normal cell division
MPGFGFMSGIKARKQDIIKTKFVRYIEDNKDHIILSVLVVDGKSFIQVVDRWEKRGEIPVDIEMFSFLKELDIDVIVAVNKIDKIKDIDSTMDGIALRFEMLPPWRQWLDMLVPVSAKKGNVSALSTMIRDRIHNIRKKNQTTEDIED